MEPKTKEITVDDLEIEAKNTTINVNEPSPRITLTSHEENDYPMNDAGEQ